MRVSTRRNGELVLHATEEELLDIRAGLASLFVPFYPKGAYALLADIEEDRKRIGLSSRTSPVRTSLT